MRTLTYFCSMRTIAWLGHSLLASTPYGFELVAKSWFMSIIKIWMPSFFAMTSAACSSPHKPPLSWMYSFSCSSVLTSAGFVTPSCSSSTCARSDIVPSLTLLFLFFFVLLIFEVSSDNWLKNSGGFLSLFALAVSSVCMYGRNLSRVCSPRGWLIEVRANEKGRQ